MWNFIIPVVVGAVAYAVGKEGGKKKQKKKHRRAEAERQRQIELERQKEAEKQRQIELERQAEAKRQEEEEQRWIELEEQRQQEIASMKQAIFAFTDSFIDKSLQGLILERLENAEDDWDELCAIDRESRCAQSIESNANTLPTSPYCEAIMQRLFDIYSACDIEELEALRKESEQFQCLVHSIKSCSLSATLQQLTDNRLANANTIEELQRIKKEAFCADEIEQCCQGLDGLEEAYRNRNLGRLQALRAEARHLKPPAKPISPQDDDGASVVFGD